MYVKNMEYKFNTDEKVVKEVQLTDELNIKQLFPVHWDMFEITSALPEEIDIIYNSYQWKFKLIKNISRLRF